MVGIYALFMRSLNALPSSRYTLSLYAALLSLHKSLYALAAYSRYTLSSHSITIRSRYTLKEICS